MNADELRTELQRLLAEIDKPIEYTTPEDLLAEYARRVGSTKETLSRVFRRIDGSVDEYLA